MKPRKLQKQHLEQLQKKSRRRFNKALIVGAIGIVAILMGVWYAGSRSGDLSRSGQVYRPGRASREQLQPAPTSSPVEDPTLPSPAEQDAIFAKIKSFRDAVASVTRGHAEGEELVRMFDEHHLPASVDATGAVRALKTMTLGRWWFSVVVRDPVHTKLGPVAMRFDGSQRILYVTNQQVTEPWLGFVGAHELIHVRDYVTGSEPLVSPENPEWIAGEVRAYDMEIDLIERWTHGTFVSMLAVLAPRAEQNRRPWYEETSALDALFPPAASETERGMRDGLFTIALAFAIGARHQPEDLFLEKIRMYKRITGY